MWEQEKQEKQEKPVHGVWCCWVGGGVTTCTGPGTGKLKNKSFLGVFPVASDVSCAPFLNVNPGIPNN